MKTHKNYPPIDREKRWEAEILTHLAKNEGALFRPKKLAKSLRVSSADYLNFKRLIRKLTAEGKIEKGRRQSVLKPDRSRQTEGVVSFTSKGFAFVKTPDGEEFFIPEKQTLNALHHDDVRIEKLRKQSGRNREGKILSVVERAKEPIFAVLSKAPSKWYAFLESPNPCIRVEIVGEYQHIRDGMLVELTSFSWEKSGTMPHAEIGQILGMPSDPKDDLAIVKKTFRLPDDFPRKIIAETDAIRLPDIEKELSVRKDFRDDEIFTIDPKEAKDFDDAVSLTSDADGNWKLGVHIADVSHYVTEGSATDLEARKRGTSVYFTDSFVPMIPMRLSGFICSLQPDEERLTFSVIMKISPTGEMLQYEIFPSVIRSKRRFNYIEVQSILDSQTGDNSETLLRMRKLSKILREKRKTAGSIDFQIPESIITMNDNGEPLDIRPSIRLESHELIEEFMLLANKCVAEHIAVYRKKERLPLIYRIHEPPSKKDVDDFFLGLKHLGLNFSRPRELTSLHMQKILEASHGKPYQNYIEQFALRSMTKAIYSQQPLGHFGLAFQYYTHFTSPIRRYPDLIVHRLLKTYSSEYSKANIARYRRQIPHVAKQASEAEIHAMEAEREYRKVKQIRFISKKIGKWYKGVITGVLDYGFFVEISEFLIEGLVHVRTLEDDFYVFDEERRQLRGRKNKRTFRMGDEVFVKVANVSLADKMIDLEWGE